MIGEWSKRIVHVVALCVCSYSATAQDVSDKINDLKSVVSSDMNVELKFKGYSSHSNDNPEELNAFFKKDTLGKMVYVVNDQIHVSTPNMYLNINNTRKEILVVEGDKYANSYAMLNMDSLVVISDSIKKIEDKGLRFILSEGNRIASGIEYYDYYFDKTELHRIITYYSLKQSYKNSKSEVGYDKPKLEVSFVPCSLTYNYSMNISDYVSVISADEYKGKGDYTDYKIELINF